ALGRRRTARHVAGANVSKNRANRFTAHRAFPELDRDRSCRHIVDFPERAEHAAESTLETVAGEAAHVAEQLTANPDHARVQKEQRLMSASVFGAAKQD